jgi:cytochrome oxidase Cu insertion factor (SCO1/SenC/PrrC family)
MAGVGGPSGRIEGIINRMNVRMRSVLGVLALALVALAAALYFGLRSSSAGSTPTGAPVSDAPAATWAAGKVRAPGFSLTDERGRPLALAALRGRPVIVTFIDPLCRDYCPTEAQHLSDVVRSFPTAQKPTVVAVSVNVFGNARANLLEDVRKWRLVPQWRWAVGREAQLARVWRAYHVQVVATTKTIAGVAVHRIGHTEVAYVVDANGWQRALFLWPYSAAGVERTLRALAS